jgi:hypothetical protein
MDIHETFSFVIGADAGGEHLISEERDQKVDTG